MFIDYAYNPHVYCLLSDYYVSGTILRSFHTWSYFTLTAILQSMYYYSLSSFEITEALRS